MRKSDSCINRSPLWTAWDANTSCYRRPPKFRKALRRVIKHQQKQLLGKDIQEQIEKGEISNASYESTHSTE